MSDLSKHCAHLLGKEGLGPVRGGFPISNYVVCRTVRTVGVGKTVVIFPFCIFYYWKLTYVFDCVCFIPSKSQTIMPKSLTCGCSISVPDRPVVGYHTAPTHTDQ